MNRIEVVKDRLMRKLRMWAFGTPVPLDSPEWKPPENYRPGDIFGKAVNRGTLFSGALMALMILIFHFCS